MQTFNDIRAALELVNWNLASNSHGEFLFDVRPEVKALVQVCADHDHVYGAACYANALFNVSRHLTVEDAATEFLSLYSASERILRDIETADFSHTVSMRIFNEIVK